jgi:hypothetical protein
VNRKRRITIAGVTVGSLLFLTAGACGPTAEETARNELQAQKSTGDTLEKKNLEEKRKREENPNAVRYLYLYSAMGEPMGYYITKGKVSSNGSQRTPEQDNMWTCRANGSTCEAIVVDGAQDDGSYGAPEPGIFFFLADGTMISTTLDYVQADRPIQGVNVPLLGGSA